MQNGMQISPKMWRRFVKPRWREILDLVRRACPDCAFFLHSCGKIEAIIPDIIEVGFQILHPVQPECMDFQQIRATYGRDLTLCASISAQQLFPFGTPAEVTDWVEKTRDRYASDNRIILCPSNRIQPETPWENIVAFAAAAKSGARG
jgi:uroporphyrinogen decarboxylase